MNTEGMIRMSEELEKINNLKQQIRNHIEMIEIHNAKFFKRQGKQEAKKEIIEIINDYIYTDSQGKPNPHCEVLWKIKERFKDGDENGFV